MPRLPFEPGSETRPFPGDYAGYLIVVRPTQQVPTSVHVFSEVTCQACLPFVREPAAGANRKTQSDAPLVCPGPPSQFLMPMLGVSTIRLRGTVINLLPKLLVTFAPQGKVCPSIEFCCQPNLLL